MIDTTQRSFAKAISWRIIASASTLLLTWLFTGNIAIAGTVAAVQMCVNFFLYFLHERIWDKVNWGRKGTNLS